jgi:hypothetical protein
VAETAFVASPLPVIISLEMHCCVAQQTRCAELFRQKMGDVLLDANEEDVAARTPLQLVGKVVIKGKRSSSKEVSPPSSSQMQRESMRNPSLPHEAASVTSLPSRAEQRLSVMFGQLPDRQHSPLTFGTNSVADRLRDSDSDTSDGGGEEAASWRRSTDTDSGSGSGNAKRFFLGWPMGSKRPAGHHPKASQLHTVLALRNVPKTVPLQPSMAVVRPPRDFSHVRSLRETKLWGLLERHVSVAAARGEREEVAAMEVQRLTGLCLFRVYPKGTRMLSDNFDPLRCWASGVSLVALNLQTNDLPSQLHHALFALQGGSGYVLKPPEMRAWPPLWPPERTQLGLISLQLHSLFMLPTRREHRPDVRTGPAAASHTFVPWLSGEPSPAQAGVVSSPSLSVELHAIGGFCCVSTELPAPKNASTHCTIDGVVGNGLAAHFNATVHCLAAEPMQTVLRLVVLDGEHKATYEAVVLGALRPGYRCLQLRSRHGTYIELCHLLVHVSIGHVPNEWTSTHELREQVLRQQAIIEEQAAQLEAQAVQLQSMAERQAELVQTTIGESSGSLRHSACTRASRDSSAA